MTARELVSWLVESTDLDKGLVGIDLEMLLRLDINGVKNILRFDRFLLDNGFNNTDDDTISGRKASLENYYTGFELVSSEPDKWSSLKPRLEKVLAWLKHEDLMAVPRTIEPSRDKIVPAESEQGAKFAADTDNFVKLKLARARVPQNFSAGTHLHFDVKSWFATEEHAARFVKFHNKIVGALPQHVPVGRYNSPTGDTRGNRYASLDKLHEPKSSYSHRGNSPKDYFARAGSGMERYTALNVQAVRRSGRGDIEFRFLHSTLNIATISGWFQAIAEMIEYTAGREEADLGKFMTYADKEAPETSQFLRTARERSRTSKDPTDLHGRPTKAVTRILTPVRQRMSKAASSSPMAKEVSDFIARQVAFKPRNIEELEAQIEVLGNLYLQYSRRDFRNAIATRLNELNRELKTAHERARTHDVHEP